MRQQTRLHVPVVRWSVGLQLRLCALPPPLPWDVGPSVGIAARDFPFLASGRCALSQIDRPERFLYSFPVRRGKITCPVAGRRSMGSFRKPGILEGVRVAASAGIGPLWSEIPCKVP